MRDLDLEGPMGRPDPTRADRRPSPPEGEQRAARRRRAEEELLDVRLRSREPVVDLEVRNPVHRTSYRVLFPEYPGRGAAFCSCTDFARRGLGTCKHVEAAWLWLRGSAELPEPELPPRRPPTEELWREIDRELGRLERSPPATVRDLERPGSLLFEGTPAAERGEKEEGVGRRRSGRPAPTTTSRARP